MAKKNKKSSTSIPLLSPQNYIRTRARNLAISNCYINEDWEQTGIANIIITRAHSNGNSTAGLYLVDLKCLGIKDTHYKFNIPDFEYEELVENLKVSGSVPCAYNMAHNIIFGALEFAEEYELKPHKDWELTRYILEEDDDNIPLMDIEFGEEGKPSYWAGPNDDTNKVNQILGTLKRTAGEGNFHFVVPDEEDEFDDDFEDDDEMEDEDYDFEHEEDDDSALSPEDVQLILAGKKVASPHQLYMLSSAFYLVANKEEIPLVDTEQLNEHITTIETRTRYLTDNVEETELGNQINRIKYYDDSVKLKEIDAMFKEYGPNPILYTALFIVKNDENAESTEEIVRLMEDQYPDFLEFRFLRAIHLIEQQKYEEAFSCLGGQLTLIKGFPERNTEFNFIEFTLFNAAMCMYFTAKEDIRTAIVYGGEVAYLCDDNNAYALDAISLLCSAIKQSFSDIDGFPL